MMNCNTPKVSIIVPSLNSISYIRECIDSILNQTLKDIEILCIDANSTDGTLEILKNYEQKDERLRVIVSDRKSYGYQINLGIKEAKGEYLGIVESDDYIKTNMYERLYEIAKKNDCEVVKGDFYIFAYGKTEYINVLRNSYEDIYNCKMNWNKDIRIFLGSDGINPIGIYRMDLLKINQIKLNETPGASYQDNGLWFQIFAFAKTIYFINEAFYMLRRDNPNSSVKSKEKVYCACEEYDFIRDFLKKHPDLEKALAPICALHRFGNYMFTLERIDEKYKLDFLKRFSQDFRKILKDKEIDENLFGDINMQIINKIVENPENYYYFSRGAKDRLQNQLVYRLGKAVVETKTLKEVIKLPFLMLKICFEHNFERKVYKTITQFRPDLNYLPLECYLDYHEALVAKEHLSYKFGKLILLSFRGWYKGKIFVLPFILKKTYREHKNKRI
ncbi:glycosyltransferase family 2 protein [Campylobacter coli]